jgi:hypothetical protein
MRWKMGGAGDWEDFTFEVISGYGGSRPPCDRSDWVVRSVFAPVTLPGVRSAPDTGDSPSTFRPPSQAVKRLYFIAYVEDWCRRRPIDARHPLASRYST